MYPDSHLRTWSSKFLKFIITSINPALAREASAGGHVIHRVVLPGVTWHSLEQHVKGVSRGPPGEGLESVQVILVVPGLLEVQLTAAPLVVSRPRGPVAAQDHEGQQGHGYGQGNV